MVEFGFMTEAEHNEYCAEQRMKAMNSNIDSPLRWMETFSGFLMRDMKLTQSQMDHGSMSILYEKERKVDTKVLILTAYMDDMTIYSMCRNKKGNEIGCIRKSPSRDTR